MNKTRKTVINNNEISAVETFNLGGYEQKVLIEGKRKDLPIVVCLHGGPGCPIPFSVGCRGLFPEFTNKFIMVYWDQLGCGINNYKIDDSFNINMFVNMTVDLIKILKNKYTENKLFIFAVSWGSVLSAKAVSAVPNLIDGVAVYGQVMKELSFNQEVFDTLKKSSAPEKVKKQINLLNQKDEHLIGDLKIVAKWIRKYTDGYQYKSEKSLPIGSVIKGLLFSPDYQFRDFIAIVKNGYQKNKSLLLELMKIDISETLAGVEKPYYIIQGNTDIVTSTKAISEFVSSCSNANLHCEIIKNSGHLPSNRGMEAIVNQLSTMSRYIAK